MIHDCFFYEHVGLDKKVMQPGSMKGHLYQVSPPIRCQEMLLAARHVIAFTGAGISTGAGKQFVKVKGCSS